MGGTASLEEVSLLPANSLLLTLKFENTTIERIGQGWRANPAVSLSELQLANLMSRWISQKALLQQDANEAMVLTEGKMPQYFVIATLAGKTEGAVYAFYPQLDNVLIHDQQQQRWLTAPMTIMTQLFAAQLVEK